MKTPYHFETTIFEQDELEMPEPSPILAGEQGFAISEVGTERKRGADYIRWVQRALKTVVGVPILINGQLDAPTRRATKNFQQKFGKQSRVKADGIPGPKTRHLLALALLGPKGELELAQLQELQEEGPETIAAGAAVVGTGFEILKSVISPLTAGDVQFTGPTSPIGIRWPSKPPNIRYTALNANRLVVEFREVHPWFGYEFVNIRLRCLIQYNGPEVEATFRFDADGKRSRLATDTALSVGNPLSLETRPMTQNWKSVGVQYYPVVRIPIELRINRPWPLSNYNEVFTLVLSGLYGFGGGAGLPFIIERQVRWT